MALHGRIDEALSNQIKVLHPDYKKVSDKIRYRDAKGQSVEAELHQQQENLLQQAWEIFDRLDRPIAENAPVKLAVASAEEERVDAFQAIPNAFALPRNPTAPLHFARN